MSIRRSFIPDMRLLTVSLLLAGGLWAQAPSFDVLITGAKVIDGSGNPWYFADIGIRGDTIAAVGNLAGADAARAHRRPRLVVAPGFIDIHSHGRRGIFQVPTAENYLREGVTTIVEGPDGSSPLPLAPFLDRVAKTPISINFATMVGQGSIRQRSDRPGQPQGHARRNRKDEGAGRAGHARRRVRPLHRTVLRARQLHAHRGSHRDRQGGGAHGRHPHLAHARRSGARARQRARDHPHRRRGRAAHADHAPQDHRPGQLGA